jgi:predicted DNA-binding protein with PD1-like motif
VKTFRGGTAAELIPFRLEEGENLVPTLARAAEEINLGSAAVVMGAGSLAVARLAPVGTVGPTSLGIITEHEGPLFILSMQGWILANQPELQLTLSRGPRVLAGRAIEGCLVRGTVEGLLLRLGNLRLGRLSDPQTGDWALAAGGRLKDAPRIELNGQPIDLQAVLKAPPDLLGRHRVLPFAISGDTLLVATADPRDLLAYNDLRQATGMRIQWVDTPADLLLAALHQVLQWLQ